MRFSIWPSLTQPWADVVDVVQHAEATGWDGVYVADHFMGDAGAPWPVEIPTLEATAALAALAAATERVRLSPLVLGITYRHPAVLAKWAATVDHVSGGRLLLGVGAGWQENEHEQYGIPLGLAGGAHRALRGGAAHPARAADRRAHDRRGHALRGARRAGRAEAGAGAAADPRRRQGRPHAAASSPATPTSGTCGRTRRAFAERSAVLDAALRAHRPRPGDDRRGRRRRCSSWSTTTPERTGPSPPGSRPGPRSAGPPAQIAETVGGVARRRRRRGDRPRLHPRHRRPARRRHGRPHRGGRPGVPLARQLGVVDLSAAPRDEHGSAPWSTSRRGRRVLAEVAVGVTRWTQSAPRWRVPRARTLSATGRGRRRRPDWAHMHARRPRRRSRLAGDERHRPRWRPPSSHVGLASPMPHTGGTGHATPAHRAAGERSSSLAGVT